MTPRPPQLLIAIVVLLAVLVLGMAGLCGYRSVAASVLVSATAEQQTALARLQRQATLLQKERAARLPLAKRVVAQPATWTWSEQLPSMMTQLSTLADASAVRIDTMQPSAIVTRGNLLRFPLRISVHASLGAATAFLRRVQEANPVLAVDQLSIRPGQKPADPLTLEITLSSYVRTEGRPASGGRR